MDWKVIRREWPALVPSILDYWPEADEDEVLALDGTRRGLVDYITSVTGRDLEEVNDEVSEWHEGGIPADVRMNAINDNVNIVASGRSVPEGEDVYDDDRNFGDDNEAEPPMGRD